MEQAKAMMDLIEQGSKIGTGVVSAFVLILGAAWFIYQLKPLIENNTKAIELMRDGLETFGGILVKVSDRIIAHDERSVAIQKTQEELCGQVAALQRDVSEMKGRMNVQ